MIYQVYRVLEPTITDYQPSSGITNISSLTNELVLKKSSNVKKSLVKENVLMNKKLWSTQTSDTSVHEQKRNTLYGSKSMVRQEMQMSNQKT